jgi:hypothetical protein
MELCLRNRHPAAEIDEHPILSMEERKDDSRRKQMVFLSRLLEKQLDDELEFQEWFCQKDMSAKVVRRGKVEDEAFEGLVPSYGEEAEHHIDGHDLKLLPVCFW